MLISKDVTLTYTNSRNLSIDFKMFTSFDLRECKETLENDIKTEKTNYLSGESVTSKKLNARHIEINGILNAHTGRGNMKRQIEKIINTDLGGVLTYKHAKMKEEFHIFCEVESLPDVVFSGKDVIFSISLLCPNPYWRGEDVSENLSYITTLGKFPLVIPMEGFIFGYRQDMLKSRFENVGDTQADVIYTIKADGGTVKNPFIRNDITGEELKIFYELNDNDYITIISKHDISKILINGEINGSRFLLDENKRKFFLLDYGENTVAYGADENAINLSITAKYEPLYLGVDYID